MNKPKQEQDSTAFMNMLRTKAGIAGEPPDTNYRKRESTMHILKLEAENVKRLEAVSITPDGNMVVIGGPNGAGKSSTLDCIEYALGGKKRLPGVPIHKGADKAQIILETDMYTVKRTFTEKDSYIEVKTKEGYTVNTPQDLLNALVGDLSFDPLEFTRMDSKKQAAILMRLLGLDFTELDAEYQQVSLDRRDIGRDGQRLKSLVESLPEDEDAPQSEVVVSDLMRQMEDAQTVNEANASRRANVNAVRNGIDTLNESIAALEEQLAVKRENLAKYKRLLADAEKAAAACVDVDTEPIAQQIRSAEDINGRVRIAKQRKEYAEQYNQAHGKYESMTARLREIEETKQKLISEAAFPVPGVTFSPDGVLVNGIPFDQASSAEQLRIAVAMGLSTNPKLRIILIRDGSLLDESSLEAIAEMAERYDAQVWMERVGEGKEVSVVIKDGRIAENRMISEVTNDAVLINV